MRWIATTLAFTFAVGGVVHAQSVVVRDPGPGPVGRELARALAGPHRLLLPLSDTGRLVLPRDSVYAATVVVLGRSAVLGGRVGGDVFVVGGDLFLHPGAQVDGRAIAIGGGVYPSMLAVVRGGMESHRDFTYLVARESGEYALEYRSLYDYPSEAVTLPGLYGVRLPQYDRSDGLSLPFAPLVTLRDSRLSIEPSIAYRSHLGAVDPAVSVSYQPARRDRIMARAERGTFTNDAWIYADLINSASVLVLGYDTRNRYRADRAELTVHRLFEGATTSLEPFVGARWERAWSIGPDPDESRHPWSAFERTERDRMLRPNPPIDAGHIGSVLAGARLEWSSEGVQLMLRAAGEGSLDAPADRRFVQTTIGGDIAFPTFASHWLEFETHLVLTAGDTAPSQRWAYLGGSGTLPLLEPLSMGGDRLVFVQSSYHVPVEQITIPYLGVPTFSLRHILGAAGTGALPDLEQDLGVALDLSFVRLQFDLDPATRASRLGVALSLLR